MVAKKVSDISLGQVLCILAFFSALLALVWRYDHVLLTQVILLRSGFLSSFFLVVTNIFFVLGVFYLLPIIVSLLRKKWQVAWQLMAALGVTTLVLVLVKLAVERPRPAVEALVAESSFSFPSNHTGIVFASLPILFLAYRRWRWLFIGGAICVAFSRVYLGVHYPSDVVFGCLLGLCMGGFVLSFSHGDALLEFRRKFVHVLCGMCCLLLLYTGMVSLLFLAGVALVGLFLAFFSRKIKIPILAWCLRHLERKGSFPGKGAITLTIGIALCWALFPIRIALVSSSIVVFADATATGMGSLFGRTSHPLHQKKSLEGSVAGFVIAVLCCIVFFPWWIALITAAMAMLMESLEGSHVHGDDNISVPLVAGVVLWALTLIP